MNLTFNYSIPDLVTNILALSGLRSQSVFNNGGDAITDNTKLTNEDEALITKYLKAGCAHIADIMSGYASGILDEDGVTELDPFEFDAELGDEENQIIFRAVMPDTFVEATVTPMDEVIKDALENYVIFRTAKIRGTEFQSYEDDYNKAIDKLRSYLNRRSSPVKRSFNLY